MKYALLIALREYLENVKTKGFWIGISIFPLLIFASIRVPILLEQHATPARYYVLVDQSGQFEKIVDTAMDRARLKRLLTALTEYATQNAKAKTATNQPAKMDLEKVPAPDNKALESFLDGFADTNPQAIDNFTSQGGREAFLKQIKPLVRTNAPAFKEPKGRFARLPLPAGVRADAPISNIVQQLRPYLRGHQHLQADGQDVELYAAILIPPDIDKKVVRPGDVSALMQGKRDGVQYWSSNLADQTLRDEVERAINAEIRRREYEARGMDTATIRKVERTYAPVATLNPKKEEGKESVSMADYIRQYAPSAFVYLLWVAIFSVAQMLLNNTIEEKSNRIIEVLLSSVTPGELMTGKLLGIAAIGITMVGTWISALFGILAWRAGPEMEFAGQLLTVLRTSNLLPAFAFYFLFGYLMYSAVIMALGSVCNTLKEAQNFMGVITMMMMVPLLTMMFIPKDPNGALARVLSWIPIYTPFVMMNRATADPPAIDLYGTMALMLLSTLFALWAAAKIFRVGVLRTGQPPRFLELLRWLRVRH
ncbi:MAG TPA: ABC transporter permease [Verrucomicrobiae bacterium]|nr:ABC transporter permease [Verrucomicrobiae bacterium]